MQKFKDLIARYSGYTRFIEPIWSRYVGWVAGHPKTAAMILVGLAVVAAL